MIKEWAVVIWLMNSRLEGLKVPDTLANIHSVSLISGCQHQFHCPCKTG